MVDKRDLPKLKKEYNIIGMHSQGNKTYIRFLAEVPYPDAESCEPNIEDAYMLYLWNNGLPQPFLEVKNNAFGKRN